MNAGMSMLSVLLAGLGLGVRHALEADHLAAVATLVARRASLAQALRLGACWGVGHSLTLSTIGGMVLALDRVVPEQVAGALELAVGVMLIVLGVDCVRRLRSTLLHRRVHRHADGTSHEALRSVIVGMVHGMAGSAALVLLTLGATKSVSLGMAYVVSFGVGSIGGMALLSFALGLSLRLSAMRIGWIYNGFTVFVGLLTCALGVYMVHRIAFVDGLLTGV